MERRFIDMEMPVSTDPASRWGSRGVVGMKVFCVRAGIETPLSSSVDSPGFSGECKDNLIFGSELMNC